MSSRGRASSVKSKPAASGPGGQRPKGRSRRGLFRIATRSVIACAVVGCLTVVAGWHASGLVRRGEIDRMLRMGATSPQAAQAAADAQARGKLDKGRLKALVATAGK